MDDDGRDPSMFTNPYFWMVILACLLVWVAVAWAVIA